MCAASRCPCPTPASSAAALEPAFRVRDRTFATLAGRDTRALLELSRHEQHVLTRAQPGVFAAARRQGRGFTVVELRAVDAWLFEELLVAAWRRIVPRRMAARWDAERAAAVLPANAGSTLRLARAR